jgi:hypothetical protein
VEARDFGDVVRQYAALGDRLSLVERKRVSYARKRLGPACEQEQ